VLSGITGKASGLFSGELGIVKPPLYHIRKPTPPKNKAPKTKQSVLFVDDCGTIGSGNGGLLKDIKKSGGGNNNKPSPPIRKPKQKHKNEKMDNQLFHNLIYKLLLKEFLISTQFQRS
jgi:hypothetical protein